MASKGKEGPTFKETDPVSNLPYLHLSFIIHNFVPIRFVRRQKPFDDPTFTGSYTEGYRLPTIIRMEEDETVTKKTEKYEAVTCMMVRPELVGPSGVKEGKYFCLAETDATHPGYCRMRVIQYLRQAKSAPAPMGHLTREKSTLMLKDEVNTRGNTSRTYLSKHGTIREDDEFAELEALTHRSKSAQSNASKKVRTQLPEDVEYALALQYPHWPECAQEWVERKRPSGWPGKRIEQKVVAEGCHVTPSAHPKSNEPKLEWMFVFFKAESTLSKEAVSSAQRQCFLAFAMLTLELIDTSALTYKHLKAVFYNLCENVNLFLWRSNPAHCVMRLLDSLIKCVHDGVLPDYFVQENNMFSQMDSSDLAKLEKHLVVIRKNPIEVLFSLAEKNVIFDVFPFNCRVRALFDPVLMDAIAKRKEVDMPKSIHIFMESVDQLCNMFYLDTGHEYFVPYFSDAEYYTASLISHCFSSVEEAIEYFVKPALGDAEAQKMLKELPGSLMQKNITLSEHIPPTEVWRPIRMCRLLISKYATNKRGSDYYDHLGCMYNSASHTFENQKNEAIKRAEEAFKNAISREDCGTGTHVDYGGFLYRIGRYEDSIAQLKIVLQREIRKMQSMNFYGKMEYPLVEEYIQKEIQLNDGLEVHSAVYAFHFLIECYRKLGKKKEVNEYLKKFSELCKSNQNATAYAFLGYSLINVQKYKQAREAFKSVLDLEPKNKLAPDYINYCRKMEAANPDDETVLEAKTTQLSVSDL